jgi:hypothetical protein
MGIAAIADMGSLMDLFFSSPPMIGDIVIDVLLDESPTYDYVVTEHPVEAGLDITDTRIERPTGLSLECILTDTAFDPASLAKAALQGNLSMDSWKDKKDTLYKLKSLNKPLNVSTPLNFYKNMMITNITPNATAEKGGAFFFRIEFREIRMVASVIGYVDPSMLPADLAAVAKGAGGAASKAGPAASEGTAPAAKTATSEANQSVAAGLAGNAFTSGQDGLVW